MTTSTTVRVFVNAAGLDVPAEASALDAVRQWSADQGEAVVRGERLVTDSRGIAIDPASAVYAGAIYRLVSNREGAAEVEEST